MEVQKERSIIHVRSTENVANPLKEYCAKCL